jgi:hypothetical protein
LKLKHAKLKHEQQNAYMKLKHVKLERLYVDAIEHVEAHDLDLGALRLLELDLQGPQPSTKKIVVEIIDRFYNEKFKQYLYY